VNASETYDGIVVGAAEEAAARILADAGGR
jgi:hypothetical protein